MHTTHSSLPCKTTLRGKQNLSIISFPEICRNHQTSWPKKSAPSGSKAGVLTLGHGTWVLSPYFSQLWFSSLFTIKGEKLLRASCLLLVHAPSPLPFLISFGFLVHFFSFSCRVHSSRNTLMLVGT